jgi:flagellar hook assembly protein FlgD
LPTEPVPAAEGRWTFTVNTLDDQGLGSTTTHRFSVNSTLGSLRVAPRRVLVRATGGSASIRWSQARPARVKVTIETPEGIVVRTVATSQLQAGAQSVTWDGRAGSRKLVAGGAYVARVTATNELGAVTLTQPLTVRRIK